MKSNFQKNFNEKKLLMDDNVKLMIEPDKNINSLNNEFNIKNEINSMDLQSFNKPLLKENYS
ncbi:hypothetical protein, partial [Borreliella garinii]|uniref:hypothetical protein n=1 Tax=Borreliella garinii TaxID=29519 RepID=UPI001AEF7EBE